MQAEDEQMLQLTKDYSRVLEEINLDQIEERVNSDLIKNPNLLLWLESERDRIQLLAEVRRLNRLLSTIGIVPVPVPISEPEQIVEQIVDSEWKEDREVLANKLAPRNGDAGVLDTPFPPIKVDKQVPKTKIPRTAKTAKTEKHNKLKSARLEEGYTGDVCQQCGGMRMIRTGKCSTCQECGYNDGCT